MLHTKYQTVTEEGIALYMYFRTLDFTIHPLH